MARCSRWLQHHRPRHHDRPCPRPPPPRGCCSVGRCSRAECDIPSARRSIGPPVHHRRLGVPDGRRPSFRRWRALVPGWTASDPSRLGSGPSSGPGGRAGRAARGVLHRSDGGVTSRPPGEVCWGWGNIGPQGCPTRGAARAIARVPGSRHGRRQRRRPLTVHRAFSGNHPPSPLHRRPRPVESRWCHDGC